MSVQDIKEPDRRTRMRGFYSSSSGDAWSRPSPLWTLRCRRKFETTEKWRPHPSTSQANAGLIVSNGNKNDYLRSSLTLLACVAVHVCLKRAGAGESLVANLALVLLLAAG